MKDELMERNRTDKGASRLRILIAEDDALIAIASEAKAVGLSKPLDRRKLVTAIDKARRRAAQAVFGDDRAMPTSLTNPLKEAT